MVLLTLLSLVPIARILGIIMAVFALWMFRDVLVQRSQVQVAGSPLVRVRRWKLAVFSGLAAAELVLCLVGVTS